MVSGKGDGGVGKTVSVLVANSLMIAPSSLRLTTLTDVAGCFAAWLRDIHVVGWLRLVLTMLLEVAVVMVSLSSGA